MQALKLRDAKAAFSAVVDAAERGEPTTITRNGRPAAVVVSVEQADALGLSRKPSFAELLMSIPCDIEFERDYAPMREIEL